MFRRHDVLRVSFSDDGSCRILEDLQPSIEVFELTSASPAETSEHLVRLWTQWAHSDPPGVPYVRHFVSLLPDGRQRVHEYFCGLSVDYASFTAIKMEAEAVYRSPETLLPVLPELSYRDYTLAVRAARLRERGEASWAWWLERVQSFPPPLSMPLASKQKLGRSMMDTLLGTIPAAQWVALKRRCDAFNVSPSILFYAMLAEVWASYHSTRHFTMAMMYTRRLPVHRDVEKLLGNFYTVMPLEVDVRDGRTFDALLRDLQEQTVEIHRHLSRSNPAAATHGSVSALQWRRPLHPVRG